MSTGAGGWQRAVLACGLAAICVAVLGGRVYGTFERVRVRLVKMPLMADGPSMSIELPAQSRLAGLPTALILRIQGSSEPADLTVMLDGQPVARVNVPARDDVRIDTSIGSGLGEPHALTLTATRSGWALNYLEVASLHGFAGSPLNLVIVPRDRMPNGVLPAWMLVPLLIALIWTRPQPAGSGPVRYLHFIAAGLVLLLFGVALLARAFTQYGVLLSLQTWLFCAAVLYAEPLSRLWRRVAARAVAPDAGIPSAPALPGRGEVLWAFAGLAAVIGVVLHKQVMNLDSVPDLGDPLFSIWRLSWVAHQLTADPRHLFDANIFYPARHTLTFSDAIILPAITAMPLRWSGLHPVVVYNLLMLSAFVLSGLATYLLARGLGFGVAAAWISAVIFSLYSFRIDHYSHLELQMSHWMPLALLFTHRVMTGGRRRFVLFTALATAAQWYTSMYYGLFLSLYVAAFALVLAFNWKAWRRLGMVAAAVVLGAALAWPLARAYSQSQQERGGRPVDTVRHFSATPADYLRPTPRSAIYGHINQEPGHGERELFPGVVPAGLAVAGAWPPLSAVRLAVAMSGLVAFDGSLGMNGALYPWLYEYAFPFRSVRVPARFAILVGLSLALLSGAALDRWRGRIGSRFSTPLAVAAITALIAADAWPALRLVPVWRHGPPIYESLGPSSGAVLLEYPINPQPDAFAENMPSMYFSAWHLTPMVNGYSGFIPDSYAEIARNTEGFPGAGTVAYLKELGVTHISVVCALDGTFGPFGVPVGDQARCDRTITQLDADPRLGLIIRTRWEGAPALLYQIRK